MKLRPRHPAFLALVSVFLWSTLAPFAVRLARVPPFFLLASSLAIGSLFSIGRGWKALRLRTSPSRFPVRIAFAGGSALFLYHFLLFAAFRLAPPVEANLLNYLWPVGIVLLSPLFFPGERLTIRHCAGVTGAATGAFIVLAGASARSSDAGPGAASVSASVSAFASGPWAGYAFATLAALVWALYSLWSRKIGEVPIALVGAYCAIGSIFAALAGFAFEPAYSPSIAEWLGIAWAGVGPLGLAFYTWDAAMKGGDPKLVGTLAYLTPVLSTALLGAFATDGSARGGEDWVRVVVGLVLIVGGAYFGRPRTSSTLVP